MDRRKRGSKHHLLVDGRGRVVMAVMLTGANRLGRRSLPHEVTQLLPLLDAVPPVRRRRGRPRRRFDRVQGDRAYDSGPLRAQLRRRGIEPVLARRRTPHGSGLGAYRCVVERAEIHVASLRL